MAKSKDSVNEAAWNLSKSVREASQVIADSAIAAQERNLKFAQSTFENGVELLKSHAQSTRALTQTLVEQAQKQQEAFQVLARETLDAYVGFLYAPFSYYEQTLDTVESIAWQGVETAQKISRQGVEAVQRATHQEKQATQAATK